MAECPQFWLWFWLKSAEIASVAYVEHAILGERRLGEHQAAEAVFRHLVGRHFPQRAQAYSKKSFPVDVHEVAADVHLHDVARTGVVAALAAGRACCACGGGSLRIYEPTVMSVLSRHLRGGPAACELTLQKFSA